MTHVPLIDSHAIWIICNDGQDIDAIIDRQLGQASPYF